MISVQSAQQRILAALQLLGEEYVPLEQALGRRLAQPIHAASDYPLFDHSSVDGFAVRAADAASCSPTQPASLKVVADIPAGIADPGSLADGQAARIMTGAPIPAGADAVVMIEDTDLREQAPGSAAPGRVEIYRPARSGEYIRRRGSDLTAGQQTLSAGRRLRPQDIGMLAMLGVARVPVRRQPRVALLSSGDELVPVDAPLGPGQIHDSNSFMLRALAEKAGCEVLAMGVAPDRMEAVQDLLEQAVNLQPDLIISSAGVSAGAFDFIKDVVERRGSLGFWKVNMRPGKPLAFGSYRDIPFFGLPGNPVSSYVSFLLFVLPAIDFLSGAGPADSAHRVVTLGEALESDGRESYLRTVVRRENWREIASLTGHQGSGNLFSMVQANALLVVPAGVLALPAGAEVEAWMLDE